MAIPISQFPIFLPPSRPPTPNPTLPLFHLSTTSKRAKITTSTANFHQFDILPRLAASRRAHHFVRPALLHILRVPDRPHLPASDAESRFKGVHRRLGGDRCSGILDRPPSVNEVVRLFTTADPQHPDLAIHVTSHPHFCTHTNNLNSTALQSTLPSYRPIEP